MPHAQASVSQPKKRTKRTKGAEERDEFLRSVWREELGRVDPSRLVFIDEMGTHTSLAPLYAYSPVGERAFFEIPVGIAARTPRSSRPSMPEGWGHLWPWKEAPPPGCSRPTWRRCWLPPCVRDG